jgi:multidrug resistance efflux pump
MQNQMRVDSSSANSISDRHDVDAAAQRRDEGAQDAQSLQRDLEARLNPKYIDSPKTAPDAPSHDDREKPSRTYRRLLKAGAGVAIVAVFGWLPLKALLQTSSVEAVVNSRLVTLRSPIDGQIAPQSHLSSESGTLTEGTTILRVINPRGDRVRLDDLRRQLSRLDNERPSLVAKLETAQASEKDLGHQATQFTEGRIRQLEARIAEIQTAIEAATARREDAVAAVERASSLAKSGNVSTVELSRLTRDQIVAQQTEAGARRRLDATQVELTAAREGTFLGDSYNDRPSSVQRKEEMHQRVADLNADIVHTDAEIAWLTGEIASEQLHYSNRSEADLKLPVAGRIWEVMTAPGEDVRAGQPLLRLLDCSGAVVTANVTEGVYNRLQLGSSARFQPSDGGPELAGSVVNLTGSAGAAANLAINPDVLNKEPYRVTVSVPGLNDGSQDCKVGRTGRVIFSGGSANKP